MEYITPEEAGRRLCVSTQTINRYIRSGNLPATKFGRLTRILNADLDTFCTMNGKVQR